MGKNVTYTPNTADIGRLLRSPRMRAMCVAAATRGQAYAEQISPVRTGTYRRSFRVVPLALAGRRSDRAGAKLVNDAPEAPAVEWRWGYRVLGRTVDVIEKNGP